MMRDPEAYDILMQLDQLGVAVELHGNTILFRPASAVPDGLLERMREHKKELVAILRDSHCPPPSRYSREFSGLLASIPDSERRAELRARFEGRAGALMSGRGLPWDECERIGLEGLRPELLASRRGNSA